MTEPAPAPSGPPRPPGRRRDAVLLAVGTLTALRVPPPSRVDRDVAGAAMVLAPLVGLLPGGVGTAVAAAASALGCGDLLCAALALAALALVTRGLHLDGLADTADGFAASYQRDRALAVMRRGDCGPAGVSAVVLVLLVQTAALTQALATVGPAAVLIGAVAGRAALPVLCRRRLPAARPDGLGAAVAATVGPLGLAGSLISAALVTTAVLLGALLVRAATVSPITAGASAVLATGVGGAVAVVLGHRARARLGGITGDTLGAGVETATAAAWVVLAAAVGADLG